MPAPLDTLARLAALPDASLPRRVELGDATTPSIKFALYDLLRHEQALAAAAQPIARSEVARILDLVQMASGELVGLLVGRSDGLLESARDGEWTLRDLLRHAIAVELRYAAQVEWSAAREDRYPLAIPDERLPCDRLSPPDPDFADSRTGGMTRMLELLGMARARSNGRLARIRDAALARPSMWGTLQITVRMRLHQSAAHLTEVVVQGEKMLASGTADSEARRILRHLCAMRGIHERWSDSRARDGLDARATELSLTPAQDPPELPMR